MIEMSFYVYEYFPVCVDESDKLEIAEQIYAELFGLTEDVCQTFTTDSSK